MFNKICLLFAANSASENTSDREYESLVVQLNFFRNCTVLSEHSSLLMMIIQSEVIPSALLREIIENENCMITFKPLSSNERKNLQTNEATARR